MEFKGIELHDIRGMELNQETGGYMLSRLPLSLEPKLKANARVVSGAELRLVLIDDEVRIKIKKIGGTFAYGIVYYGSVQSGWRELYKPIHTGECEITLKKSKSTQELQSICAATGAAFSPEVVRVVLQSAQYEILDVIGQCRPPRPDELPKKTYLAYGSSITHGSLAIHPADSYPFRVSQALGVDYLNLGFAGCALLEPEMADYIADCCQFSFASLEMGINLLSKVEPEELERRARYFVSRIAKAHPEAKIFCTDVIYQDADFFQADDPDRKINLFRRAIKRVVEEPALPNLVYLPALSLLDGVQYLTEDLCHPNSRGTEVLAQNLIAAMQKELG